MWQIEPTNLYLRRLKRFHKKFPREARAALDNLDTYVKTLQAGIPPAQVKHGFMHREPAGVVAIDQKGGGVGLKEARLYVYPSTEEFTVFLITLGDKNTQSADIRECTHFVTTLEKTDG